MVLYVATAIFLCFMLPFIVMYITFIIFRPVALPVLAIAFIFGLVITIRIIRHSGGSVVESLTVDSSVLTVKYRAKASSR